MAPQRPSQGASSSKPLSTRGSLRRREGAGARAPAPWRLLSLAHPLAFPAGTPWRRCRPACSGTCPRRPWA